MKFKILGSGGCTATPKPLCQCHVCTTARTQGYPYARCGPSLYLEDAALVIDTPEDIAVALNNSHITAVNHIMYSHWDPDHTLGLRIMEQLRLEWLEHYAGEKPQNPIYVHALPQTMEDLNAIKNKFGSFLDFYEHVMHLIKRQTVTQPVEIGEIKITLVPVPKNHGVAIFVFESQGKKLVYAPCDCSPIPDHPLFFNADVLIIGETIICEIGKGGRNTTPPGQNFHTMAFLEDLQQRLNIGKIIVTHIEELEGKTYGELAEMEKKYTAIAFAYDGMEIVL